MALRVQINSNKTSFKISLCILSLSLLSGCASGENAKKTSPATLQDYAAGVCDSFSANNYVQVLENLRMIKLHPDAKDLKSYKRVEDLIKQTKLLIDNSSKYTAELRFFCDDLKTYKTIINIPSIEKIQKAQENSKTSFQNSGPSSSSSNSVRSAPNDYLAPLNRMYPHWVKDISGPLTGSRSDFGIIDVLFNVNSRCSLWIFSSFANFERFNQVWGNTFTFNYPAKDQFGNIYATENSIYSTTCAMEYSDVFG